MGFEGFFFVVKRKNPTFSKKNWKKTTIYILTLLLIGYTHKELRNVRCEH